MIAALTLILTLYFYLPVSTSPTNSSNQPLGINGDLEGASSLFGNPQIIVNPLPGGNTFGRRLFVHQAGYLAVEAVDAQNNEIMLFYYTDQSGAIQGPQEFKIRDYLPAPWVICNGAFAPIFNYVREVYYFFLSVGVGGCPPAGCSVASDLFATHVILFSLDTSVTTSQWVVDSIQGKYSETIGSVKSLRIPITNFTWDASSPWIGTFGDRMQVVLDDNTSQLKHSLYVNGSNNNLQSPGGNLYWFIITSNTVSPTLDFIFQIQDAKLLLLYQMSQQNTCSLPAVTYANYLNSFGSNFFVTSGMGNKNILLVANVTSEDYCSIPGSNQAAAPLGYIQGFTLDTNGYWVQTLSGSSFDYRYFPEGDTQITAGFGYTCARVNNFVFAGMSLSIDQPNQDLQVPCYTWNKNPIVSSVLTRQGTIQPGNNFLQTPVFPAPNAIATRYNFLIKEINDGGTILVTTYNNQKGDVISIQLPTSGANVLPYSSFTTIQNIGSEYYTPIPTGLVTQTWYGFGQFTDTWISRSGLTVRLAFNDPDYFGRKGRIIILTKARSR